MADVFLDGCRLLLFLWFYSDLFRAGTVLTLGANDVQEVWRSRLSTQQSFILNFNASSSLCYKYLLTQPGASACVRRPRPPARGPHVYQPSRQLFSLPVHVMTVISLIVLSGDIQINPGPLQFGYLNCCSAEQKVPLIHDLMKDNSLDVLLLSETWFTTDTPQFVLLDVAPPGYAGHHVVRSTGAGRPSRGG